MTKLIDVRDNKEFIRIVKEIEERQNKEKRAERFVFWTGFAVGVFGTVGSLVVYNQYQAKKNQK